MSYPKYKNKHSKKALYDAKHFTTWIRYLKKDYKKHPTQYILLYYPSILNHFIRKYKPKKIRIYRVITIYQYKNIGVVQMTGVGSPHAVMVFEELIALGGKVFLNIGSAGGLENFGIFLCDKAVRDEGTSYHYLPHGTYTFPNKQLTNKLAKQLRKRKIDFQRGTTWTIDAPYRETKEEIQHYKKRGVKTVDMETSALFAVAKIRGVKMASAFVVSDVLGKKKWDPQFGAKHVKRTLFKLFDAGLECLLEK